MSKLTLALPWLLLACAPSGPQLPLPEDPLSPEHPFPSSLQLDPLSDRLRVPAWALDPGLPEGSRGTTARGAFAKLGRQLAELDGTGVTGAVWLTLPEDVAEPEWGAHVEVLGVDGAPVPPLTFFREGPRLGLRPLASWRSGAEYVVVVRGLQDSAGRACVPSAGLRALLGGSGSAQRRAEAARVRGALAGADIPEAEVCLAFSFRVQSIALGLIALRQAVLDRAARLPPKVTVKEVVPAAKVSGLAHGRFVESVVYGTLQAPEWRDEDGKVVAARLEGREEAPTAELRFALSLPKGSGPFPLVLGIHGLASDVDRTLPLYAEVLGERGFAYVTIDGVGHGSRQEAGRSAFLTFLDVRDVARTRDRLRQTLSDLLQLRLTASAGFDRTGVAPVQRAPLRWSGGSYGGIMGVMLSAIDDGLEAAHVEACGGPWREVILSSGGAKELVRIFFASELGLDAEDPLLSPLEARFVELAQWVVDPGDVSALAEFAGERPLVGSKRRLLMQYWKGETLMPNSASELLARSLGAPLASAGSSASGRAAVWPFDVAAYGVEPGVTAHGAYWQIPAARAQALRFLSSGGTEVTAP